MTALVLLLLVSPGESDAAVTLAVRQAAIQVHGPATAVVIREATDDLSDVAALEQADALHAVVVARLSWTSRSYTQARLRVHLAATDGWTSREVGFEAKDTPAERGRALGYAIAAVVAGRAPSGPMAPAAPQASGATPLPDSPPLGSVGIGPGAAAAPPTVEVRIPSGRFWFLDAAGATSTGLGGSGGQARLGWSMTRRLRMMFGGGGRAGTVDVAQASSNHLYVTAGAALDLVSFWRTAVACRAEGMLVRQSLSHFSSDDIVADRRSRWLVGVRPALELSIWPSRLVAIIASSGWELTTGSTDVYVRGARVAVIPAARMVGELGVRVHFW